MASIVDWMKARKMDSSYNSRAKLANQYGIKGYQGTANQNISLLGHLQKPKPAPKPVVKAPVKPIAPVNNKNFGKPPVKTAPTRKPTKWEEKFFQTYGNTITRGVANPEHLNRYNAMAKQFGWKAVAPSTQMLQDLSIKALNGDKKAQDWLKGMRYNALTGANLWKGYDPSKLQAHSNAFHQYRKDNPFSTISKTYDNSLYDRMNQMIKSDDPMTEAHLKQYQELIKKWNFEDWNNPLVQHKNQIELDRQEALKAQDSALNNSMATMDSNNFKLFQQLQQTMSDRGIGGSGIEQDAYGQMQMAANRDYQDAFVDAAGTKSNINTEYNNNYANANIAIQKDKDAKAALAAEQKFAEAELAAKTQAEKDKIQLQRDEFLTKSSGYMYINGKPIMANGKPITTIEFQKLNETQRHNIATENNISNKNQLDYLLGKERNAIADKGNQLDYAVGMAKIQADIQKASASLQLGYAKLDLGYAQIEADLNKAKGSLDIAARNAATSEQKAMITGVKAQIDSLQKQIKAQKNGKATDAQKKQLKALMERMDNILTGKE